MVDVLYCHRNMGYYNLIQQRLKVPLNAADTRVRRGVRQASQEQFLRRAEPARGSVAGDGWQCRRL